MLLFCLWTSKAAAQSTSLKNRVNRQKESQHRWAESSGHYCASFRMHCLLTVHRGSGYEVMTSLCFFVLPVSEKPALLSTSGMSVYRTTYPSHWVTLDCMEVKAQTQKKLRWIQARRVGSHSILVSITSLERFSIHKCHYPPILPPWWLECCRSHICRWWQSQRYCWGRSRSLLN